MARRTFTGTNRDDYFRGTDIADWILGRGGDDDLSGGGGDDLIDGGDGNDLLEGGAGNDTIDGGAGIDAINYQGATGEVFVDLAQGYAREFAGPRFTTDTLRGIEVVIGSRFDDSFVGSAGNDDLRGGAGNDVLNGGAGDDILRGDAGDDLLDGGAGFDYADYFYTDGAVVNLNTPVTTAIGAGRDDLRNIEGVIGSRGADTMYGNGVANHLIGEAGDDLLYGNGSDDRLSGGAGRDRLVGGAGADELSAGTGADRFIFADGDLGTSPDATDRITDFSHAERDLIDLARIDADTGVRGNGAFAFIGAAAFSGTAGEVRFEINGGQTVISGDVNGDGAADGFIVLTGQHMLVAADFVL